MNILTSEFGACVCPLCETAAKCDTNYFSRPFADPDIFAGTSEAISETLGFCPRHGAILLNQERLSGGVIPVIHDAVPRLRLLLAEKYLQKHQVQQILFGTDGACPACAYTSRVLGRQAASLARQVSGAGDWRGPGLIDTLCAGHFQMFAANLALEIRLGVLTGYAHHLEQMAQKIQAILGAAQDTDTWPLEDAAATLNRAFDLIGGRAAVESISSDGALDDALMPLPTLVEAIALPHVCPLCVEAERVRQRWLQNVQKSAGFGQDAWLFFPTCPEHVAAVARIGETRLTAAVVSLALDVAYRHVHKQIPTLVRAVNLMKEEARIKAEGPEVWREYKRKKTYRKRPVQKPEGQSEPAPRLVKCSACEWAEIAAERATDNLLKLLHEKKHRDAYSRGYGLCLKHFARVYLVAHKGAVRAMLAEDMQLRLSEFARGLDELACGKNTGQDVSLKTSLRRFCNCI
ncbi:MAG TPA: hypothetical protein VMV70_00320 [Gallionella sp.]|nr:hypothetical protein [Gallionella sp.]HUW75095.1 hypothetical protein [Gallionella sp.]